MGEEEEVGGGRGLPVGTARWGRRAAPLMLLPPPPPLLLLWAMRTYRSVSWRVSSCRVDLISVGVCLQSQCRAAIYGACRKRPKN